MDLELFVRGFEQGVDVVAQRLFDVTCMVVLALVDHTVEAGQSQCLEVHLFEY